MKKATLPLMLALCGTLANAQENFYEGTLQDAGFAL